MLLLLDSSGPQLVAALARAGRVLKEAVANAAEPAGRDIASVVARLLEDETVAGLEAVAVGIGPGSFIGTRVAASFANGLAAARPLSLQALPTLAAFAAAAPANPGLAVLRDARRAEAYLHCADRGPDAVELVALSVLGQSLDAAGVSRVIAECGGPGDKQAAQWQREVTRACAGRELRWMVHVPPAGLLALAERTGSCAIVQPLYLRGYT